MPSFEAGLLKQKIPSLHKEPEVERAVSRREHHEGRMEKKTPEAKIDAYLDRLESVFQHPDEKRRVRNLDLFKPILHEEFVVSEEHFPESYFELQKRIARNRGQEVADFTPEERHRMIQVIREDQTKSLDDWVDYLGSSDAGYPVWFKYLAFRSILKLSQFDKELGHFKRRTKDTTAPYPEIYREALGIVADKLDALAEADIGQLKEISRRRNEAAEAGAEFSLSEEEEKLRFHSYEEFYEEFRKFSDTKFADLYAEAIQASLEASLEGRENTHGEWIVYPRGDMEAADRLYGSLQGKGTGWCTAGKTTAANQIAGGDFYVFYTYKESGDSIPTSPRIAIRMSGDQIAEVRGVLQGQEIEPILQQVVDEKLETFGDKADRFKKKSADMRRLTLIEEKDAKQEELNVGELRFLYEIEGSIEGFGYSKDPRIKVIQSGRDVLSDMLRMFETEEEVIGGLLKSEQSGIIIEHLLEFSLPQQKIAEQFIDSGHARKLADNISVFSHLDQLDGARIETLLRADSLHGAHNICQKFKFSPELLYRRIASSIEFARGNTGYGEIKEFIESHIPLESRVALAETLVTMKQGYFVVNNLEIFPELEQEALAMQMIAEEQAGSVIRNFEKFAPGLDQEIIIQSGFSRYNDVKAVAENIGKFYAVDSTAIANQLIARGHGSRVLENIANFPEVDSERVAVEVLSHASFSNQDHIVSLAFLDFLRTPAGEGVDVNYIFQQVDPKVVDQVLYHANITYNEKYRERLAGRLDAATAKRLFSGRPYLSYDYALPFANIISLFSIEARNGIADMLLDAKYPQYVYRNLRAFPDLDHNEFFKKLIFNGLDKIPENELQVALDGFSNLRVDSAELLLLRGKTQVLGTNLDKFSSLTEHIARKLIGNGYLQEVRAHQESFTGLLPETLAQLEGELAN